MQTAPLKLLPVDPAPANPRRDAIDRGFADLVAAEEPAPSRDRPVTPRREAAPPEHAEPRDTATDADAAKERTEASTSGPRADAKQSDPADAASSDFAAGAPAPVETQAAGQAPAGPAFAGAGSDEPAGPVPAIQMAGMPASPAASGSEPGGAAVPPTAGAMSGPPEAAGVAAAVAGVPPPVPGQVVPTDGQPISADGQSSGTGGAEAAPSPSGETTASATTKNTAASAPATVPETAPAAVPTVQAPPQGHADTGASPAVPSATIPSSAVPTPAAAADSGSAAPVQGADASAADATVDVTPSQARHGNAGAQPGTTVQPGTTAQPGAAPDAAAQILRTAAPNGPDSGQPGPRMADAPQPGQAPGHGQVLSPSAHFASELRPASGAMPVADTAAGRLMPGPVVEQVAIQISRAASEGQDKLTIDLRPAVLGRVSVSLELGHDHRVIAVVSADRPDTLDLLQRDARALERALQDAGLKTDSGSLSFSLNGHGGRQTPFGDGAVQEQLFAAPPAEVEGEVSPTPYKPYARVASATGIDIHV